MKPFEEFNDENQFTLTGFLFLYIMLLFKLIVFTVMMPMVLVAHLVIIPVLKAVNWYFFPINTDARLKRVFDAVRK